MLRFNFWFSQIKSKCLDLNYPLLSKNPQNIHTREAKINSPKKRKKKKKKISEIDCQAFKVFFSPQITGVFTRNTSLIDI